MTREQINPLNQMTEPTAPIVATFVPIPIDKILNLIEDIYLPPTARRWRFWKKDRKPGSILLIDDRERFITYGSDAYNLAARSGLMVEYHSMGGVSVPAISLPQDMVNSVVRAIRDQGQSIEFVY